MSAVYFIRPVGHEGPVKVGFSRNPNKRLASCQPASPWPLEFATLLSVAPFPGKTRLHMQIIERRFHERYLPWHLHHEWFAFNALLADDIAAITAGTFDVNVLPEVSAATWRLPPATRGTKGHVGRPALKLDSEPRRPPAAQAGDDAREPHNNSASSPTHPAETAA